ncbi:MAG: ankyrin repeat domain-containing protein, partial [Synergistaceae bacterium]|nr:ankyrin repeat domain-containing protein [Synergistaceae bacterium]
KKRVAEILLKHGADANIKDEFGRTALMIAERNHHSDVAELLRRYGATK